MDTDMILYLKIKKRKDNDRNERKCVLINDRLNSFYLLLYGIGHM